MAVQILEMKKESCPAARLIGKKYEGVPNWDEWWNNNWFEKLEVNPCLSFNGDAYIGAVHIVNGMPERWIGMFRLGLNLSTLSRWIMPYVIYMTKRIAGISFPWIRTICVWKN